MCINCRKEPHYLYKLSEVDALIRKGKKKFDSIQDFFEMDGPFSSVHGMEIWIVILIKYDMR